MPAAFDLEFRQVVLPDELQNPLDILELHHPP